MFHVHIQIYYFTVSPRCVIYLYFFINVGSGIERLDLKLRFFFTFNSFHERVHFSHMIQRTSIECNYNMRTCSGFESCPCHNHF